MLRLVSLFFFIVPVLAVAQDWPVWGGNAAGTRYSALQQINTDNVNDLQIAWQVRTGAVAGHTESVNHFAGFETNPILTPVEAGQSLVVCTPFNEVVAFDPVNGKERWRFDPRINLGGYGSDADPAGKNSVPFKKCRGVAFWRDTAAPDKAAACVNRIVFATNDLRLFALDARNGKRCKDFGVDGEVNVEPLYFEKQPVWRDEVKAYNPPVIAGDVMIVTTSVRDNHRYNAPAGTLRAFSVRSGALVWEWDPVPRSAADPAYASWDPVAARETGGAQAWGMLSVDAARDLVFVPTSGPSPDFFGGTRPGNNEYADSIVALRASTGAYVWHFQTVHHNVWDYDNAAQPVLVELRKDGKPFPAVIQATKTGMLYIFHRETGEPYFPIEERPVPTDGVKGDVLSPTQPFPVKPPPLVTQTFSWEDEWWLNFGACHEKYKDARVGPIFTPPSEQGTIMMPSSAGGVNWGSVAIDESTNTLVTNVLNMPHFAQLIPNDKAKNAVAASGETTMGAASPLLGTPYHLFQGPAMSPRFLPCTAPPWAKLVAVDLERGEIKWEVPLGTIEKLSPIPLPIRWGAPSFGGAIVTAGGLVFIGATADNRFRAFSLRDGEELWSVKLPTGSFAHPMTYAINGKQYVVIVSGGHPFVDQDPGDWVTAFTLPD